jgi:hypothetical protein
MFDPLKAANALCDHDQPDCGIVQTSCSCDLQEIGKTVCAQAVLRLISKSRILIAIDKPCTGAPILY